MRIGIRDGCLQQGAVESLATAAGLGFDGVEICIGDEQENVLWQPGGTDQVAKAAEAAGVAVSSLSPGMFANLHPVVEDEALRAKGAKLIRECIERCGPVGAGSILVPMFPKDMADWPESRWQELIDGFKPLADAAAEAGVVIALETTFSADQLIRIVDGVASPAFKAYYDTANTTFWGYHCPTEIRALGDRLGMVHVKDTEGNDLGNGKVPWRETRQAIDEVGYDGWYILETPAKPNAVQAGARNYGFTRGWLV